MDELNSFSLDGINLNNYRIFYVVVNTMNFTKASETLCTTQPAISYAVKKWKKN